MMHILYFLALALLHLASGANGAQVYDLLVHPADAPSTDGFLLANISIDSTTIQSRLSSSKELSNTINIDTHKGWCVSLLSQFSDGYGLECFNYFNSLTSFSSSSSLKDAAGELSLALDAEHHIQSATFSPGNKGKLSLSISRTNKLPDPQPRLRLDGKTDLQDDVEVPLVEAKGQKAKKPEKLINKDVDLDDADEMKNFQEIVKPKGLYSDDKTFIEKYWVYIVPPMLVFFVVGNLGGQ